ncbi:MAG: WD40 repeat domain-containing protein [Chloroflexi bacterium]|nr:WD40 repeat domain-containing protein [Chloroflexota bacterium]
MGIKHHPPAVQAPGHGEMNGDYFEQDVKPPVRKRLTQIVIVALLITSVVSLIAVKVLSDQRQQAIEKTERAVSAQETVEARATETWAGARQTAEALSEPAKNILPTVTAVTAQSHSRELAYAALAQLYIDPERSIQLAVEANRAARTPEAEDALRRSLLASHLRYTLSLSAAVFSAAQFSPDGAHVLTHAGRSAQVWSLNDAQIQYTLQGDDGDTVDANYSHDGQRILTVSADKSVRVWRADTGALLFGLMAGGYIPLIGRFSPDDQRFAAAAKDGTVQIYDAIGGAILADFRVPDIVTLVWSSDGQSLLTIGLNQPAVRVWDSRDGSLRLQEDVAASIATFSPDSRYLAVAGAVGVDVWGIGSGQEVCTIQYVTATGLQYSPRGDQLLISDWNAGRVTLWDMWTPTKCTLSLTGPSGYAAGIFSPDGGCLALHKVGDPRTITLWSYERYGRGLQPMTTLRAGDSVIAMQFSADSRSFLTINLNGAVQVWSVSPSVLPDSIEDLLALAQAHMRTSTPTGVCHTSTTQELDSFTVAGADPIWTTITGGQWTSAPLQAPYEGSIGKGIWFVKKGVQGELQVTGRQIDGDGKILFFYRSEVEQDNNGNAIIYFIDPPAEVFTIEDANASNYLSPIPDGYLGHVTGYIVTKPGCYQLTAAVQNDQVEIVFESK